MSATGVIILLGILSVFHPGSGVIQQVSLGGRWGTELGGSSPGLAAGKLFAIAIIVPTVLFPTSVGRVWVRCLMVVGRRLNRGICITTSWRPGRGLQRLARYPSSFRRPVLPVDRQGDIGSIPGHQSSGIHVSQDTAPQILNAISPLELFIREELATSSTGVAPDKSEEVFRSVPDTSILSDPDLLEPDDEDVHHTARLIERTLASHGVEVKVQQIRVGPRIARFGIAPGWSGRTGLGSPGPDP